MCSSNQKKIAKKNRGTLPSMWSYCTFGSIPTWSCLWKCGLISGLILVLFAFGKSSTFETLKKQSRFRCFSGWSWTTRWQFPIYKQGLSLPVCSCPAAVSSTVEARICPCMFSATQMSCGAAKQSGFGPVTYQDIHFPLLNDNRRNFHEHPYGCYILNPDLIDKRGSPCYILLTQNFTRKKAFWGPFPNNSFRPPFFSGNLS